MLNQEIEHQHLSLVWVESFKPSKILVHICCSIDSHYFLQELRKLYKDATLIGFFYDPNIHPISEYELRYLDVERSCRMLDIALIKSDYEQDQWFWYVKGYENCAEKGERCTLCFDMRLWKSGLKAQELGIKYLTTTLLASPKKSPKQLIKSAQQSCNDLGITFLHPDFRTKGGTQKQFALAKDDKLYHQDYCGCLFALYQQREAQNKLADELFSDIANSLLPESIAYRLDLYERRIKLEAQDREYRIVRTPFINYRQLRAFVKADGNVIPSYFLFYSHLKKKQVKTKIEFEHDSIFYAKREGIVFLNIKTYNTLVQTDYTDVRSLMYAKIDYKAQIALREKLNKTLYSNNLIIIIDSVDKEAQYQITCQSELYNDVIENLVIF